MLFSGSSFEGKHGKTKSRSENIPENGYCNKMKYSIIYS